METIIDFFAVNTKNSQVYVYLKTDPYKRKRLKSFKTFNGTIRYYVGTEKNKTIFSNIKDIEKIESYLN